MPHSTAVDIDHENDRYTSFTIIVLGEFTYAILVNSPAQGGLNLRMLRAVWYVKLLRSCCICLVDLYL